MRDFVTGASGWIGSAAVEELLGAGHEVVGPAPAGVRPVTTRAIAEATRAVLPWRPTGPTLIEDIEAGSYAHA